MLLVNLAGILGVIKLGMGNDGLQEENGERGRGNDTTLLGRRGHGEREQRATVAWIERVKDRWSCVGGLFAEDIERRRRVRNH